MAVITGIRRVARLQNDLLLHYGNFFRAHFYAQVAARDHHAVGDFENFVEIVDGFRLFELGDYRRIFPARAMAFLAARTSAAVRTKLRAR